MPAVDAVECGLGEGRGGGGQSRCGAGGVVVVSTKSTRVTSNSLVDACKYDT